MKARTNSRRHSCTFNPPKMIPHSAAANHAHHKLRCRYSCDRRASPRTQDTKRLWTGKRKKTNRQKQSFSEATLATATVPTAWKLQTTAAFGNPLTVSAQRKIIRHKRRRQMLTGAKHDRSTTMKRRAQAALSRSQYQTLETTFSQPVLA